VADAARTRQPVWLSSRAEAATRYPAFADPATDAGRRSWAALPLAAHGATLGALGLSFDAERVIPADERAFMLTLATQCAQALERARLYEAEERARAAAAAGRATRRVPRRGEPPARRLARLPRDARRRGARRRAAPRRLVRRGHARRRRRAADAWPPQVRRLAVMHQDPAKLEWARELERRQPPDWTALTGLPRVLREGVTEFYPVIDDAMLVASARSPEELALLREIGFTAYLCVPLRARGRVMGAITLCMTESGRHYDAADRLLAEELAHRAGLAVEHAELYREAQQANAAKTQFLAVMSHELRTPLNAIGGYAELLALGIRGPVTTAQGEDLERIRRSQQHLLTLINDVLDFARIEAGQARFRIDDVRVGEVLDGVLPLVAPQAGAKRQALDAGGCDPRLVLRADAEKVRQVLLNLLSNAIKFTGPGGRIALRCVPQGAWLALAVHDTGIGIPADRSGSIFEPFVQVQSGLTRTAEGTGLGLAISRDLARGMGGDLTVESTPGEGSTFTLTLPAATAP
jgi:signal transduction histidine kinase